MTTVNAWLLKVAAPFALLLFMGGAAGAASGPTIDNRVRGKVDAL